MKDFFIKMAIFIPVVFGFLSYLEKLKTNYPFTIIFAICVFIGIAFYYAIETLINSRTKVNYYGCVINLQDKRFECPNCGNDAHLYFAEIPGTDETKFIIQCSSRECATSTQGFSLNQTERSWMAMF